MGVIKESGTALPDESSTVFSHDGRSLAAQDSGSSLGSQGASFAFIVREAQSVASCQPKFSALVGAMLAS